MKEVTEDYVSFETRNLLWQKGMPKDCFNHLVRENTQESTVRTYYACSLYKAMKWLRDVHGVHLAPFPYDVKNGAVRYLPEILIISNETQQPEYVEGLNICKSYEQAAEVAIKWCLENLI